MTTETEVIANQSAYIPPTEDQVKILQAKELMMKMLPYVDDGLKIQAQVFIDHA